ncbi:MAG: mannonate dehydratase, partial [Pannonibacter phragmitetus]
IAEMVDSPANGFTFCTGSYGVRPDNNLVEMFETHADRVHFLHLRATKREADPRSFHEAAHLDGDVDMVAVIKAVLLAERRRGIELPMRPDHGHQLLDDLRKTSNPGYPAIGRLRGLAELRGVERAIRAFI